LLGLVDELGLVLVLGLTDSDADPLGLAEPLGLTLGDSDDEGETEGD
jgi:hypothetical protein